MWHKGRGRVVYDPCRDGVQSFNWVILDVDKEITRYYRWWVKKEKWINLNLPSRNAHLSVVRAERVEESNYHQFWGKYQGKIFDFDYEHDIKVAEDKKGGHFFFVNAVSSQVQNLRSELGLFAYPHYHITIGRTYY